MSARLCRVCREPVPSVGALCDRCFTKLYPEAAARQQDTRYERTLRRRADDYEQARAVDEADAPVTQKEDR